MVRAVSPVGGAASRTPFTTKPGQEQRPATIGAAIGQIGHCATIGAAIGQIGGNATVRPIESTHDKAATTGAVVKKRRQ